MHTKLIPNGFSENPNLLIQRAPRSEPSGPTGTEPSTDPFKLGFPYRDFSFSMTEYF